MLYCCHNNYTTNKVMTTSMIENSKKRFAEKISSFSTFISSNKVALETKKTCKKRYKQW